MKAAMSICLILIVAVLLVGPMMIFGCKSNNTEANKTFTNATSATGKVYSNATTGQQRMQKILKKEK